jgi:predicted ester cyclase
MTTRQPLAVLAALALCGCKSDKDERAKPDEVHKTNDGSAATGSAATGSSTTPPKPASHSTPEAKLQRFTECWDALNSGKYDVFGSCFAATAVREQVDSVPELLAEGRDQILDMVKTQKAAFPDLKITPQVIIVSGNNIAAILHITGTNTAEADGMKATGKKLGMFEAEIAVVGDDDKLTRDSFYVDQPTIYHQLGLFENDSSPKAIEQHMGVLESQISHGDARELANKAVVKALFEAVNKKDASAIDALAAPDIKLTYHGDKQKIETKKAYLKWFGESFHTTTDGKIAIKELWTAGEFVVAASIFTGTPTEAVAGKDAATMKVETQTFSLFRITDGKIKQHHIFANRLKSAVQLQMVDADQFMKTLRAAGERDAPRPKRK